MSGRRHGTGSVVVRSDTAPSHPLTPHSLAFFPSLPGLTPTPPLFAAAPELLHDLLSHKLYYTLDEDARKRGPQRRGVLARQQINAERLVWPLLQLLDQGLTHRVLATHLPFTHPQFEHWCEE